MMNYVAKTITQDYYFPDYFVPGNILRKPIKYQKHSWVYQYILILDLGPSTNPYNNEPEITFLDENGKITRYAAWILHKGAWEYYDLNRDDERDEEFKLSLF